MSQDASVELLEIENRISKLQDITEQLQDEIYQKDDEVEGMKQGRFESWDSFSDKQDQARKTFARFRHDRNERIKEMKQEISDLEARKKQLNEELFGGLDESDDF